MVSQLNNVSSDTCYCSLHRITYVYMDTCLPLGHVIATYISHHVKDVLRGTRRLDKSTSHNQESIHDHMLTVLHSPSS
jgi:hypothetical protein